MAFPPDPKRVHHFLFGAWYEEDLYDRLTGAFPDLAFLLRSRITPAMRARKLLFVHVPRVAGTSIVRTLYGEGCIRHHSIRFYRAADPAFCAATPSFALLRDPFDRFASAYSFVRSGGTDSCRLSDVFRHLTRHVRTADDYLDFLEDRPALELDFVMRPQSWFVCDLKTGAPLVDDLFLYGEDNLALAAYLGRQGVASLPWLNRSVRQPMLLNGRQRQRIAALYAADFALIDSLRTARRRRDSARAAAIAAE